MIQSRLLSVCALLGAVFANVTQAQVVQEVIVYKGSDWIQTSAADPIPLTRNQGPNYGGPVNFGVYVAGTNLAGIAPPTVTLPAGSEYRTQNPVRHNGGVLFFNGEDWVYGVEGGGGAVRRKPSATSRLPEAFTV